MSFCPISANCLALGLAISVIRAAGGRAGALRPPRQDLGPPVGGLDLAHQGPSGEKIFWPNGPGVQTGLEAPQRPAWPPGGLLASGRLVSSASPRPRR